MTLLQMKLIVSFIIGVVFLILFNVGNGAFIFALGAVHILRHHIFRIFGLPSPNDDVICEWSLTAFARMGIRPTYRVISIYGTEKATRFFYISATLFKLIPSDHHLKECFTLTVRIARWSDRDSNPQPTS